MSAFFDKPLAERVANVAVALVINAGLSPHSAMCTVVREVFKLREGINISPSEYDAMWDSALADAKRRTA